MARCIIGPYIEQQTGPLQGWHLPHGFSRGVDFRALPDIGPTSSRNVGIFFADRETDYDSQTHTALPLRLDARALRELESQLDLHGGDSVPVDNLAQFVRWALRRHGDGTGKSRWKPLMPGVRSKSQERRQLSAEQRIVLREGYKAHREQWERDGGPESRHYLKWLGYQQRKYGLKQIEIEAIQDQLPKEKPQRPETTHTESFDGADSPISVGYDQSWTVEAINGWGNKSNQAEREFNGLSANYRLARCDSDVSGDDMRAESTLTQKPSGTAQAGVAVRCSSSVATTYYFAFHSNGTSYIAKFVAGTYTQIATASYTVNANDILSLEVDGSDLEFFVNGTSRVTGTDSSLTGHTRGGLYALNTTGTPTRFDDFTVEDLNVPPSTPANLTATKTGPSQITVEWEDSDTETGYTLERDKDGGGYTEIATPAQDATSHVDSGLDPGTYTYRIDTVPTSGNYSNTEIIVIPASDGPNVLHLGRMAPG